jgi:hypothetical protein
MTIANDESLMAIVVPLSYKGSPVSCDSMPDSENTVAKVFAGSRVVNWSIKGVNIDHANKKVVVYAIAMVPPDAFLPPGKGHFGTLTLLGDSCCTMLLDTTLYPPANNVQFVLTNAVSFYPVCRIDTCHIDRNNPPVIEQPDSLEGYVDSVVTYTISGTDPDGDVIQDTASINIIPGCGTYSITRTSGHGTSSGTWTINWKTQGCTACTTHRVIHDLTDVLGATAYCTTKVHLRRNRPPVIEQPDSLEGYVDSVVTYTISGTDPDGDVIRDTASINIIPGCGSYSITRTSGHGTSSGTWTINWNTQGCIACTTHRVIHDLTDVLGATAYCTTKVHLSQAGEPWPNHKMHFPQLPDLIGWDVNATMPKTLADDWQCSQYGWVTDIHFWGSWKDLDSNPYTDDFFTPMPMFRLSIHENIPATPDTPWSRPGKQVWSWVGEIPGIPSEPPSLEGWYDPNTDSVKCNDHVPYWQYDFVNMPDSFFQYKDRIYWLDISAVNIPLPYQWGWKNSRDHFMDDAVYTDNVPVGPWNPITEPPRCNWFDVYFNPTGFPQDMGSTNYYGNGWYRYEYWTNMWFYDNPFTYTRPKHIWLDFFIQPVGPMPYAEFAINWSTPAWDTLGMERPPLPGENEMLYIGRQIFPVVPGPNIIDYTLPYNPEWVSVDFLATDVMINGWIYHECIGTSLDLAFVITGHEGVLPVKCGDVNNDGILGLGDVVYLISYQYKGGPAPVPCKCVGDVNNDDIVGLGDVVYLITYQYKGGPAPNPNCCNPPWGCK